MLYQLSFQPSFCELLATFSWKPSSFVNYFLFFCLHLISVLTQLTQYVIRVDLWAPHVKKKCVKKTSVDIYGEPTLCKAPHQALETLVEETHVDSTMA